MSKKEIIYYKHGYTTLHDISRYNKKRVHHINHDKSSLNKPLPFGNLEGEYILIENKFFF